MPTLNQLSKGKLSFLVAPVLFVLAGSFIHVVHPGGFEGQLVWGFALLPGILPAQLVAGITDRAPLWAAKGLFATAFTFFNLLWYWLVAYGVVKLARRVKPWDGF